ncbi:type II toxin-antitoxin system HicA family toxin [Sphingomonas sp.]|uniref:type II toxin-antitoxin system HicA family toxin n=1 Tax=Sphingomonas sp. TaxID=28214 RepID=UPI0032C2182A
MPSGRQRGSHEDWTNDATRRTTIVPRHSGDILEGTFAVHPGSTWTPSWQIEPVSLNAPASELRLPALSKQAWPHEDQRRGHSSGQHHRI